MTSSLTQLLRNIRKDGSPKVLTKLEEIDLGNIIHSEISSDEERRCAIHQMVLKNVYLSLKMAHTYTNPAFDLEDLACYGILGLFRAAELWQPDREVRFASYARHWIKESILKAIKDCSGTPKIPIYLGQKLRKISRILSAKTSCTDTELATDLEITVTEASYYRSLLFKTVEFDSEYHVTIKELDTPEDICNRKERVNLIHQRMQELLTKAEFQVVAHFMSLPGFEKMTLVGIGRNLNITNPRKLKISAFKKLQNDSTLRVLYSEREE